MSKTVWILADAEDRRPRDHILGIFDSEAELLDAAREYANIGILEGEVPISEEGTSNLVVIDTLDDLHQADLTFYFLEGDVIADGGDDEHDGDGDQSQI